MAYTRTIGTALGITGELSLYSTVAWTLTVSGQAFDSSHTYAIMFGQHLADAVAGNEDGAGSDSTTVIGTLDLATEELEELFTRNTRSVLGTLAIWDKTESRLLFAREVAIPWAPEPDDLVLTTVGVTGATQAYVDAAIAAIPGLSLSDDTPAALGTASAGTGTDGSRSDHVHAMPDAADVGADATGTAVGLMTAHTTTHPAPTIRDVRNEAASTAIQTHITGTGSPHTPAGIGAAAYEAVAALPASPVAGTIYRLTTADDTAKAAPGWYVHDGTGWACLAYSAPYDLGNLTGAVGTLTLIPGAKYIAAKTGEITSMDIVLTRTGIAAIRTTGAQTVAVPTATGRTVVGYDDAAATAWTDAGAAIAEWTFEDDGTYMTIIATALEA